MPGDSLRYRSVARVSCAFMYHCGTAPVAMHIANGMHGALIVDPARPRPKAKEFVFVESGFDLGSSPRPTAPAVWIGRRSFSLGSAHSTWSAESSSGSSRMDRRRVRWSASRRSTSLLGGGAIFELRLREPGDYPFVTHAFADATKRAVGALTH
jgi:hypothetical protein